MRKTVLAIGIAITSLSGCATWDTTNINQTAKKRPVSETSVTAVGLTSSAFDPAKYEKLGDLEVSVNKTTAFHPNPTVEMVEQKLKSDAAKLGATKVVEAKISDIKVTGLSWGTRTGTGIAVRPK